MSTTIGQGYSCYKCKDGQVIKNLKDEIEKLNKKLGAYQSSFGAVIDCVFNGGSINLEFDKIYKTLDENIKIIDPGGPVIWDELKEGNTMKKVNGFWTDTNNNQWDCNTYSKERAVESSKTLINCNNCVDCTDCTNCTNCRGCDNCRNCRECCDCRDCRDCNDCNDCGSCRNCDKCNGCRDCRDCNNCRNCRDCRGCHGCHDCRDCNNCRNCANCISCGKCNNCRNCANCVDCTNCVVCSECHGCYDCRYCRDCNNCRDCRGCSDCSKQPEHYSTLRIGSRYNITHFYKIKSKIMVRCGCFYDTLAVFTQQVKEVYPAGNKYRKQYMKEIGKVKKLWK